MEVKYIHDKGTFPFTEGDYVTIVVGYLYVEIEDELFYHGHVTKVEEDGFWCVLDDNKVQEEYFSFLDIEDVIPGDKIPFLGGTTKRLKRDYPY